jgi:N-acetylmuramoyl-L-alanine amidase
LIPVKTHAATLSNVSIVGQKDSIVAENMLQLSIKFSSEVKYKTFILNNPERFVIDVFDSTAQNALKISNQYINRIRTGIRKGDDLRLVVDMNSKINDYHTRIDGGTIYIAMEMKRVKQNIAVQPAPKRPRIIMHNDDDAVETRVNIQHNIIKQDMAESVIDESQAIRPKASQDVKPQMIIPFIPKQNISKQNITATQELLDEVENSVLLSHDFKVIPKFKPQNDYLGEQKIIVIDAGHGGKDSGAIGVKGKSYEKNITLSYSLALRDRLERAGQYKVLLTRDNDKYIKLYDRVQIARHSQADLFISIHANAHANYKTNGFSLYTLSHQATDKEAEKLAKKENRSDIIAGIDLSDKNDVLTNTLISLAQMNTSNSSARFAKKVINIMQENNIELLRSPHRSAGFRVLTAPDMPSLLVELGYVTNPQEQELLLSKEYQENIVGLLSESINEYFAEQRLFQ